MSGKRRISPARIAWHALAFGGLCWFSTGAGVLYALFAIVDLSDVLAAKRG